MVVQTVDYSKATDDHVNAVHEFVLGRDVFVM